MNGITVFIDWILFIPLACCVAYLFFYAAASRFYRPPHYPLPRKMRRILVLFPAYSEDRVIVDTVRDFLNQDYPKELYKVAVISDHMSEETDEALRQLPVSVLKARYADSSKAKALAFALEQVTDSYDIIAIMDSDNLTVPTFLSEINRAFDAGCQAVQAHRTGKNPDTDIAILDAISEEINNGFFRSGHNAIGLSAGLSGSGMAFQESWLRRNVGKLQTAGEDKELEALLLKERIHIHYLCGLPVYDEKVRKSDAIKNQRKRWIAVQFAALHAALPDFPKAFLNGNWDYCDKILQWMLPPRLIQLAAVFGLTLLGILFLPFGESIKWCILSCVQIMAMLLPVPGNLFNRKLLKAIVKVPQLALLMAGNLFRMKGASKKFIHTEHGD